MIFELFKTLIESTKQLIRRRRFRFLVSLINLNDFNFPKNSKGLIILWMEPSDIAS